MFDEIEAIKFVYCTVIHYLILKNIHLLNMISRIQIRIESGRLSCPQPLGNLKDSFGVLEDLQGIPKNTFGTPKSLKRNS